MLFLSFISIITADGSSPLVGFILLTWMFPPSDFKICAHRHTASIAAGNHGIPVVVAGHQFGNASGMAPRAQ